MKENFSSLVKTFHLEGIQPTWVAPNGNIITPRFYRTMKEHSTVLFYKDKRSQRHWVQLGRIVFTTEPKGSV